MIDGKLNELLRIFPEPYEYHDDAAVHSALTRNPHAYLDALMRSLQAIADGRASLELPPKALFADPGRRSDFRVMPCVVRFPDRVRKTVKIIGTNWPRRVVPGEISVGKAFALHAEENFIEAGFAGCILSSARTGACAVTGMRLLAENPETVAIIGAGRVGYYTAVYAATLESVKRVLFCDRIPERANLAAQLLSTEFSHLQTGSFVVDDLSERPDVLVLATDSEQALFDASEFRPRLVISVGADTDWQRELGSSVLDSYSIFVDTLDSRNYGDLKRFAMESRLDGHEIRDLQQALRNREPLPDHAVFVSTGSALFDNLTIDFLMCSR